MAIIRFRQAEGERSGDKLTPPPRAGKRKMESAWRRLISVGIDLQLVVRRPGTRSNFATRRRRPAARRPCRGAGRSYQFRPRRGLASSLVGEDGARGAHRFTCQTANAAPPVLFDGAGSRRSPNPAPAKSEGSGAPVDAGPLRSGPWRPCDRPPVRHLADVSSSPCDRRGDACRRSTCGVGRRRPALSATAFALPPSPAERRGDGGQDGSEPAVSRAPGGRS